MENENLFWSITQNPISWASGRGNWVLKRGFQIGSQPITTKDLSTCRDLRPSSETVITDKRAISEHRKNGGKNKKSSQKLNQRLKKSAAASAAPPRPFDWGYFSLSGVWLSYLQSNGSHGLHRSGHRRSETLPGCSPTHSPPRHAAPPSSPRLPVFPHFPQFVFR